MFRRAWFVLVLGGCALGSSALGGCALSAGTVPKPDLDADDTGEAQAKTEALLGASCSDDAQCDGWEFCDRLLCIPERPCPASGVCRDQTRFDDLADAAIPDNDAAGLTRTLTVGRPHATVARLFVTVDATHPYRGDLQVVLRSPEGLEVTLHDRIGGSANDLALSQEVPELVGQTAAGDWQLVVRDLAEVDSGTLRAWSLTLEYTDTAPVDDGRNVWSSVALSGIESPHPYTNRLDRTFDLRPWTAGSRTRVHFTRIDVERNYDFVEVLNADTGAVLDRFTGRYTDLTTREYDTAALQVRLRTDSSVTGWGFAADRVDVYGAGCLSDGECGPGRVCDDSIVCIRAPCFQQCVAAPGTEGSPCASSAECAADLYCGGDGVCRPDASCGAIEDCSMEGNEWFHILCVGSPICTEAGSCGWRCGEPPCTLGATRDDGCNSCVCTEEGTWSCTKRFCPVLANEGETCDAAVSCAEGLVCDRGAVEGASCGDGRPGICVTDEPRYCRALYAPVCTCAGQTFPNECGRAGQGEWAHAGRCELSLAIPDASATGVRHTIHVATPSDAPHAQIAVEIDHPWRGDLVVWIEAPDGTRHVLSNRAGGSADDFDYVGGIDLAGGSALGAWTLVVTDRAAQDVGVLRFFSVVAAR